MMNYIWDVYSLDCYTSKDEFRNVIFNVHWYYVGKDSETEMFASINGTTQLDEPNMDNFIDINNINKEVIIGWLESKNDMNDLQNKIINIINNTNESNVIKIELNN